MTARDRRNNKELSLKPALVTSSVYSARQSIWTLSCLPPASSWPGSPSPCATSDCGACRFAVVSAPIRCPRILPGEDQSSRLPASPTSCCCCRCCRRCCCCCCCLWTARTATRNRESCFPSASAGCSGSSTARRSRVSSTIDLNMMTTPRNTFSLLSAILMQTRKQ